MHLECSQAQPLEHLPVFAELGGSEVAHLHPAGGTGFQELLELVAALVVRRIGYADVTQPNDQLVGSRLSPASVDGYCSG